MGPTSNYLLWIYHPIINQLRYWTQITKNIFHTFINAPHAPFFNQKTFCVGQDRHFRPPSYNTGNGGTEKCKGTCETGFFASSCDTIVRKGYCPEKNGKCCIIHQVEKRTRLNATTNPTSESKYYCPGLCIPQEMGSFCGKPSTVIRESSCEDGMVCCNSNKERRGSYICGACQDGNGRCCTKKGNFVL